MIPTGNQRKRRERRLRNVFAHLSPQDQDSVLAFAEFLEQRQSPPSEPESAPVPELIPRPESESVVAAIKRLTASYPMLDRALLLNETSSLMTQHVMQGRPAPEVIDDLEALFRRHYEKRRDDSVTEPPAP